MQLKNVTKFLSCLVFFAFIFLTVLISSEALSATVYVPDNYPTIQAAVDGASPGDMIIVRDGTYPENVEVNKERLTIQSENGADSTIVYAANPERQVFGIWMVDYVNISGFVVRGAADAAGILLVKATNCFISNNIISDNGDGIAITYLAFDSYIVGGSDNNTIVNNNIYSNTQNIRLEFSNNNKIYLNNLDGAYYSSNSTNIWHSPEQITYAYTGKIFGNYLGNYWSNYAGGDTDADGIGDTPYSIDLDSDNYPLMKPFENYGMGLAESPWPMFQGNLQRNGQCDYIGPLTTPTAWMYAEGSNFQDSTNNPLYTSPVIDANGNIYNAVVYPPFKIGILALNPDGTKKWFHAGSQANHSLILGEDGTIYAPIDGLTAITADGTIKWNNTSLNLVFAETHPAMGTNNLYVITPCQLPNNNSYSHCLMAITKSEGNIDWLYDIEADKTYSNIDFDVLFSEGQGYGEGCGVSSLSLDHDGTILFGFKDRLFAIYQNGTKKWERKFEYENPCPGRYPLVMTPVIGKNGIIYIVARHNVCDSIHSDSLYFINSQNEIIKKINIGGYLSIIPAVSSNGMVYLFYKTPSLSQNLHLTAISSSGYSIWTRNFDLSYTPSPPLLDNQENIYFPIGKQIFALDKDGNELWPPVYFNLPSDWEIGEIEMALGKDGILILSGRGAILGLYAGPIPPTNQPPVANAGSDQTVEVNTLVTLDGSASHDPEGDPITFRWTQAAGPLLVALSNPTSMRPTFTPTVPGSYAFQLVVNDGKVDSTPDNVTVSVIETTPLPPPPINHFPGDGASNINLVITLQSSPPPSSNAINSEWQITTLSGNYSNPVFDKIGYTLYPNYLILPEGVLKYNTTYYWRTRYQNSDGVWSAWSEETSFTTLGGPSFSYSPRDPFVGEEITFSAETQIPNAICEWNFGDGNEATVECWRRATHSYSKEMEYIVTLTVLSQEGDQYQVSGTVHPIDLRRIINRKIQSAVGYPPYLLQPDDIGSVAVLANMTVEAWRDGVQWITGAGFIPKYNDLYFSGVELYNLSFSMLIMARDYIDEGEFEKAEKYLRLSDSFREASEKSFSASFYLFMHNLDQAMSVAQDVANLCELAVNVGVTAVYGPAAGEAVGCLYMVIDLGFDVALYGKEEAAKNLLVKGLVKKIFEEIPFPELDNRTISEWSQNRAGKFLFPMVNDLLKSDTARFYTIRALKETFPEIGEDVSEEAVNAILDELEKMLNSQSIQIQSPVEVSVTDSSGRQTGLTAGQLKIEIPRSIYENETVTIFFPTETFKYFVIGTGQGLYGLEITSVVNFVTTQFQAAGIPITFGSLHQYTIDWVILSQGGKGVTVLVDSDGNGVFERTLTSDSELTQEEFLWQPVRISGGAYFYPETSTYRASFSMDVTGPLSPSGWLKYYYTRTRMNFVSTGITSVSVSGNMATISGIGTVNGVGGYTFTATVTNGSPDTFVIVIKKSDGTTYYSAGPKNISGGDLVIQ